MVVSQCFPKALLINDELATIVVLGNAPLVVIVSIVTRPTQILVVLGIYCVVKSKGHCTQSPKFVHVKK